MTASRLLIRRTRIRTGRRIRVICPIKRGGGQLRPLLQKMESLEAERLPLGLKQRELQQAVEVTRRKRPDAERICHEWSRLTEL